MSHYSLFNFLLGDSLTETDSLVSAGFWSWDKSSKSSKVDGSTFIAKSTLNRNFYILFCGKFLTYFILLDFKFSASKCLFSFFVDVDEVVTWAVHVVVLEGLGLVSMSKGIHEKIVNTYHDFGIPHVPLLCPNQPVKFSWTKEKIHIRAFFFSKLNYNVWINRIFKKLTDVNLISLSCSLLWTRRSLKSLFYIT